MLVNFSNVQNIFIVCGHTDIRCGIDGLAGIITDKYNLDLFNDALFLFCGRKKDRFKALYWDKDGFILLYKRIENGAPTRFISTLSGVWESSMATKPRRSQKINESGASLATRRIIIP